MYMSALLSNPKRLFNYLALFVVFLNFTNLYTMISGLSAISFRHVSIIMMSVLAANIALNFNVIQTLFNKKIYIFYLLVFSIIPALSVFISPYVILRYFGYYVLSGLLFINCCLFIYSEGSHVFKRWILISFFITIFGIIASYYAPSLFNKIANMQAMSKGEFGVWDTVKVGSSVHSRAFGFYMQPNIAYTSVLFHLIILATTLFNKKLFLRLGLYGIAFFSVLLTGSRGGFIMFVVFLTTVLMSEFFNGCRNQWNRKISFTKVMPHYAVMLGLIVFIGIFVSLMGKASSKGVGLNVVEKIYYTFMPTTSNTAIGDDQSLTARFEYQKAYIDKLKGNPIRLLIGHGVGSTAYYRFTGDLPNTSHNNFLEKTFIHGIFMALAMYGMFVFLVRSNKSKFFKHQYGYNISKIITVILFVQTFTINTLFSYRLFPVLVAFWLMVLYFPNDRSQKHLAPRT